LILHILPESLSGSRHISFSSNDPTAGSTRIAIQEFWKKTRNFPAKCTMMKEKQQQQQMILKSLQNVNKK